MQRCRAVPAAAVGTFFLIAVVPLAVMFFRSFYADGQLTASAWHQVLGSAAQWRLLGRSVVLASFVTLATLAAGIPLGVLLGRTDLPGRRFFLFVMLLPLLVPPAVWAVGWSDFLAPDGGAARLFGTAAARQAAAWFYGLPGAVLVHATVFLPVPVLVTMVLLRSVPPRMEEAGRLVAGWGAVLRFVSLPLAAPGIVTAALLVFLLSLGEYTVPGMLRYPVYAAEIMTQFAAFYDFAAATAMSAPLAGVALLLLLAEAGMRRRRESMPPAGAVRPLTVRLGDWKRAVTAASVLFFAATAGIPLVSLLWRAGGVRTYAETFGRTAGTLADSLLYAAAAASLMTLLGFFIGYLIRHGSRYCRRTADTATLFLFALPGSVVGIGLSALWNTPWTGFVYATPLIIVLGYTAAYTALPSRIVAAQLALIPDSAEEAARLAGASWGQRMIRIVAPMARRGIAAAWLAAALFSLRDTSVTMIVYPPGRETLPVALLTSMANGAPEQIAALCVIILGVTFLLLMLLLPLWRGEAA